MSAGLPDGTVVLVCYGCRKFSVEGSDKWIERGRDNSTDLMDALRLLAGAAKQERDAVKAAMETPISDPRWEDVSAWM